MNVSVKIPVIALFLLSFSFSGFPSDPRFQAIELITMEEGINFRFIDRYFAENPDDLKEFGKAMMYLKAEEFLSEYRYPETLFNVKLAELLSDGDFREALVSFEGSVPGKETPPVFTGSQDFTAINAEAAAEVLEAVAKEGRDIYRNIVNKLKGASSFEIFGFITDAYTKLPVDKAKVGLKGSRHMITESVSNAAGYYDMKINIGARALSPYELLALKMPNYNSRRNIASKLALVGDPTHIQKDVELIPAVGNVTGTVQDRKTRRPLKKVGIKAIQDVDKIAVAEYIRLEDGSMKKQKVDRDNELPYAETIEDGSFNFPGSAGDRTLRFSYKGYPTITKSVVLTHRAKGMDYRIFLDQDLIELNFRILDRDSGEPVPFAQVGFNDEAPVVTDKDGIVINSFPKGEDIHITVKKQHYETNYSVFKLDKKKYRDPVDIQVEPSVLKISGRLLSVDGEPVADAKILSPLPDPVMTDENGNFSYSIKSSMDAVLAVDKDGYLKDMFFPDFTPFLVDFKKDISVGDLIAFDYDRLNPVPVSPLNGSYVLGDIVEFEFDFPAFMLPDKNLVKLLIDEEEFTKPVIESNGRVLFTCPDISEGKHEAVLRAQYVTALYWNLLGKEFTFNVGKPEILEDYNVDMINTGGRTESVLTCKLKTDSVDMATCRIFINGKPVNYESGNEKVTARSESVISSVRLAVSDKNGEEINIFYFPVY